jgi:hypothetical protein
MKRVLLLSLLTLGITTLANAQATRTWVSGVGDDANPCSRTAPCKTFAGAISKTASPGIINCLDPGGFGAVTITKSIMIDCTGTLGSILSSGVQGIIVNGLTTDKIILRNIDISGAGTTLGTNGINIIQAQSVTLENVYIETYSGSGLQTTNTSNVVNVFVYNSNILNTNGNGILVNSSNTGTTKLNVDSTHISNCVNGIDLSSANNSAVVSNSILERNSAAGFQIENSTSNAVIEGTTIAHNATGVQAGILANAPTIRLSRDTIVFNTANGIAGSGTTKCFSNNVIDGNTGSNSCSSPTNPQQ